MIVALQIFKKSESAGEKRKVRKTVQKMVEGMGYIGLLMVTLLG